MFQDFTCYTQLFCFSFILLQVNNENKNSIGTMPISYLSLSAHVNTWAFLIKNKYL